MSAADPTGPPEDATTRGAALQASLSAEGLFVGDVEAAGTLALLWPSAPVPGPDAASRLAMLRVAREHGFTHVALGIAGRSAGEPREHATGATLSRD